jgi:hypothetical protein
MPRKRLHHVRPVPPKSYGGIWVTRVHQAARLSVASWCGTPSVNLTPSMTLGNRFVPLSLRQVVEAALTRVKTMSFAVFCDSAPLVRTVRWRTVANTLSMGFEVRRWSQCSAGKS